jgi:hypothetical protein
VLLPDVYDPGVNPLYRDVLAHYGVVALPCRVRDPDRKGKVESGIGHTQKMCAAYNRKGVLPLRQARGQISSVLGFPGVQKHRPERRRTCDACKFRGWISPTMSPNGRESAWERSCAAASASIGCWVSGGWEPSSR